MSAIPRDYDSAARPPRALEELYDLLRNGPLVSALVGRDIKIRYKRSVFGLLWTFVNPVAMLIVVSLVFARVFANQAEGYPFFVISGLLLWNFISQTTLAVAREVSVGVDLWRRVRLPKSALVVSTTITGLVNLLLGLVPVIVVLIVVGRPVGVALATLPLTILLTALFVLGVALMLATAAVYFPDIADVYAILVPVLMFTAPILYPAQVVSSPLAAFLPLNPITMYVEAFRAPLYANAAPTLTSMAAMVAVALTTLLIGWLVFTRSTDDIPYQL